MKEYIEKEALLGLYNNTDGLNIDNFHVPIEVIRQNIIDQPAADVKEIVHGKWIWKDFEYNGFYTLCCSECFNTEGARENAKYCSECGAEMGLE